jgi:hypothetical protein
MRKEPYHCPYCHQTCSRHWNMKVHIQRKHGGIGQQPIGSVSLSTSPEFIPSMSNFGVNGIYRHHEASPDYIHHPSELYSDKLEESSGLPPPTSKVKDASHKLFETMCEAAEIKMLSKQIQSFSSPSRSFLGQLPYTLGLTISSLFNGTKTAAPNPVNYNYVLQFYNILISNKNVGFRGHICYNCFECWVDLLYSNGEQIKSLINSTKPSTHICNPKKVTDAQQHAEDIQSKKDELQNALTELLLFLTIICWCCFGQRKIYLKTEESITAPRPLSSSSHPAFDLLQRQNYNFPRIDNNDSSNVEQELRSQQQQQQQHPPSSFWIEEEEQEHIESNCNSIHIDLRKVEEKHWAYRAIKEALDEGKSSIEIDSGELIDFVRTTKATFGIHVTDISESIRHFFMYLSFKNNDV